MPKPRSSEASPSMRLSSSQMAPSVTGSRPARQLSAVDLPQPDGPRSATNSPRRTVSVICRSAWWVPNARLKRSSLTSRKSAEAIAMPFNLVSNKRISEGETDRPSAARRSSAILLLHLGSTDLTVPLVEHRDERLGIERRLGRIVGDQARIFRTAEVLDRLLALGRRHVEGDAVDRRSRIHVAVVIHEGLLLGLEQERHQLQHDLELVLRDALRHRHVVGVSHPVEALESADLVLLRHDAEVAWIDVPAGRRGDDVARAVGEFLHRGGGARGVVLDAAV